jgi:hypothetical protein
VSRPKRLIAFIVLLLGTIGFGGYLAGHGVPLRSAGHAILDLELARTPENARSVIDDWGRNGVLDDARCDIYIDFGFILFYALFLALVCASAASHLAGRWRRAGTVIAWAMLAAGVLDMLENAGMLFTIAGTHTLAPIVFVCAAAKFELIAIGILFVFVAHVVR